MVIKPPVKLKNSERHSREHLTPSEIEKLTGTAKQAGRHGQPDAIL